MNINVKKWLPLFVAVILMGVLLLPQLYWTLFPKPGLFGNSKPDLAAYIGESGRMPFFDGTKMDLGDTGFQAWGTWARYGGDPVAKKSFYKVSVVLQYKPYGTVYTKEFYTRYIPKDEVPDGFWDKNVSEFTAFDKKACTVVFTIGKKTFTCALPKEIFLPEGSEIVHAEE